MPIYDNSPDTDLGFKATVSFVLAIAIFGFGTLASLAVEAPTGIVFAATLALLLAVIPFVAGWIRRGPSEEVPEVMDMGNFSDEAPVTGETAANQPPPRPGEEPAERHP